jgi:SAM-dependent methyltransferase
MVDQQEEAMSTPEQATITEAVRTRYAGIALEVLEGEQSSGCCGSSESTAGCCRSTASSCCGASAGDTISDNLYLADELEGVPLKAALASLGCGNPTALAELHAGETVLDLGSGGGIDFLLSARRVGPTGFAYGLDMTDEMIELARRNAAEAGVQNVAFLKGDIAAIPLPDNSVDVIISNRVLKPGGRFAVSDIVIHGGLPAELVDSAELRRDLSSWAGCIAGALTDAEYRQGLQVAGFEQVDLEVTRRYELADLGTTLPAWVAQVGDDVAAQIAGRFGSTFVRATKPAA